MLKLSCCSCCLPNQWSGVVNSMHILRNSWKISTTDHSCGRVSYFSSATFLSGVWFFWMKTTNLKRWKRNSSIFRQRTAWSQEDRHPMDPNTSWEGTFPRAYSRTSSVYIWGQQQTRSDHPIPKGGCLKLLKTPGKPNVHWFFRLNKVEDRIVPMKNCQYLGKSSVLTLTRRPLHWSAMSQIKLPEPEKNLKISRSRGRPHLRCEVLLSILPWFSQFPARYLGSSPDILLKAMFWGIHREYVLFSLGGLLSKSKYRYPK